MDLYEFFKLVPKPELHVHLTGAVEPTTLISLAKKNSISLPVDDVEEQLYKRGTGKDVEPILPTLKIICEALVETDDFRRIAYDTQKSAALAGVHYREIFWNPTDHAAIRGVSYQAALKGLKAGLKEAEQDFGIIGRLIPSIDREGSPETGVEMVEWVIANPCSEVIGIGMDYMEINNPPEKFWKAYKLARQSGLHCTAHAGEFLEPARNVETCLDLLNCERIDHGYTIIDNPELVQRCRNEGIIFTVVPTNSTYLKVLAGQNFRKVHPLRKMADMGLKIFPNSDDPPLHHIDPASCYVSMVEDFGFSLADMRGQIENGIDAAWVDESQKNDWKRNWLPEFDRQLEARSLAPAK